MTVPYIFDFTEMMVWALGQDELAAEDVDEITVRLGRNYAPLVVSALYDECLLTPEAAAYTVSDAWCAAEYPEDVLDRDTWLSLFEYAGYTVDRQPSVRPTEPMRLYRGAAEHAARRMAWTSELGVAAGFAAGLHSRLPGVVWTAVVEPDRLLCFNRSGRDELEYVVNPTDLTIERLVSA